MKRSYQQNCALAIALDLVGERWTLLIVRELLTGPKRYGELGDNLTGMGTNLLAARLRDMQQHGLVDKAGGQYSLTEHGKNLEPVVHALVRFGLEMDIEPEDGNLHRKEWDAVALKALYQPERDEGLRGRYLFELDGVPYCIDKSPDRLVITQQECDDPVAGIALDRATGREIAAGRTTLEEAEIAGGLRCFGDGRQVKLLMASFGLEDSAG